MFSLFKWYCCRYMLRVVCVDCSYGDCKATIFHVCQDKKYRPNRPGMGCEKEACLNARRKHGIPKTLHKIYS